LFTVDKELELHTHSQKIAYALQNKVDKFKWFISLIKSRLVVQIFQFQCELIFFQTTFSPKTGFDDHTADR